jgi:hypothetical protein
MLLLPVLLLALAEVQVVAVDAAAVVVPVAAVVVPLRLRQLLRADAVSS